MGGEGGPDGGWGGGKVGGWGLGIIQERLLHLWLLRHLFSLSALHIWVQVVLKGATAVWSIGLQHKGLIIEGLENRMGESEHRVCVFKLLFVHLVGLGWPVVLFVYLVGLGWPVVLFVYLVGLGWSVVLFVHLVGLGWPVVLFTWWVWVGL